VTTASQQASVGDSAGLYPVLSGRLALRPRHAVLCLLLSALFMYLNYQPLFHTDLWGHVLYGKWILAQGSLPAEDPFMPLAEGVATVHTAWLSQVVFGWLDHLGGPGALSNLYAVTYLLALLFVARTCYLQAGRLSLALLGTFFTLVMMWTRHAVIRPEMFGVLGIAILLWMLVRLEPWRSRAAILVAGDQRHQGPCNLDVPRWIWGAVPVLFALWANLHGSFAIGLVILACHALGRGLEVLYAQRTPWSVLCDKPLRRWVLISELATAATLLNPHGIDLLIHTATFGGNPNLKDVLEWYPLKLISIEGILLSGATLMAMLLLRFSRQRVRPAEVILLLLLAGLTAKNVRVIGWFGPCFVFAAMPHLCDLWMRWAGGSARIGRHPAPSEPITPRHFAWSLICLLIVWCAFALAPISQAVLSGAPRPQEHLHSSNTPLALTRHLREEPPGGLVWTPQWWGDWIVHDGPPGIQVAMMTHVHLVPNRVWREYLAVARAGSGWSRILDRYGAGTLIVDKNLQAELAGRARADAAWQVSYEDDQALVLRRSAHAEL